MIGLNLDVQSLQTGWMKMISPELFRKKLAKKPHKADSQGCEP
jgi:hypothetical protein